MGARTIADELELLRRALQAMTEAELPQQPNRLREIARQHSNSVILLDSPHPIGAYTCLMHALDLVERPEYNRIAEHGVFAGKMFAHSLVLTEVLTSLPEQSATAGDIVLYFSKGEFQHAGRLLDSGRAVSKWGTGHLYEHGLWEVPCSYGSDIRFFRSLPYDESIYYFRRFAADRGIVLE